MKRTFFITGTDTDVGKTIATFSLAVLLRKRGYRVGVMKPIQCGGNDAVFLKKNLDLDDSLEEINPFYAQDPLFPHLAFARQKKTIQPSRILAGVRKLQVKYDILLIEGAGGLMVPIKKNYLVSDLMKDIDAPVIVVSRLGLGTINHSLLTVEQIRSLGLGVKGVLFCDGKKGKKGLAEKTNPQAVKDYGKVPVLGEVPYLTSLKKDFVERKCSQAIDIDLLLSEKRKKIKTNRLQKWDRKYLWHPFTQMGDWMKDDPLVVDQAKGNELIDTDGNHYLDGVSSLWVNVHGHRKKEIDTAVKKQIDRVSHSTMLGLANAPAVELAKELVDITPSGLDKVFYSDNGSTAVEIGIKMAYQYWQNAGHKKKKAIAHLANSYHGDTLGSVSVGGIDLFHRVYRDLIFKTIKIDFSDCYRLPKGEKYPTYAYKFVDRFEKTIKKDHEKIAAFVVEPIVQGAAGMIIWPKGVLKRMAEICRAYDVLLIVDEVATGFGRTGKMFACEWEGVKPDIMCLAKGLTAGYLPLAATLTSKKVFDGFVFDYRDQKTFFHGHTYTGNPLACAAALANLKVFEKEKTIRKLGPKTKYLQQELSRFKDLEIVGDIRQKGMMVGIELVKNKATKEPFPWEMGLGVKVCQRVRNYGIILRPLGNVIVLMPPLSITKAEIKRMCQAVYQSIQEVCQK